MKFYFRLSCFLVIICFSSGNYALGQTKINLSTNTTIKLTLKEIEKQSEYTFVYSDNLLVGLEDTVSMNVTNATINDVLSQLFMNVNISHQIIDKRIILSNTKLEPSKRVTGQAFNVSGVVSDNNNLPVFGATVFVKRTSIVAFSDMNGRYVLNGLSETDTLSVQMMGYQSIDIPINHRAVLDIQLYEETLNLSEVVVVGYNTVRRGQITGSIETVKAERLSDQTSATLEDRLQGKVAGLLISSGSGSPGTEDFSIRIRGAGSINASNTPLYIMDGTMVPAAEFAALNPEDIEDVQILKDASATAIYGSRGANGVIVLTTKKGKRGRAQISYNLKIGFQKERDSRIEMMNSAEMLEYEKICVKQNPKSTAFPMMKWLRIEDAIANGTATSSEIDQWESQGYGILNAARNTDTNWLDLMTQNGLSQEHSVTISGGDDNTRFFVSGSYLDQSGILIGSDFSRYSGRLNLSHKLNKFFSFGVNASAGISKQLQKADGGTRNSYQNAWFTTILAYPYYDETWNSKDNPTLLTQYLQRDDNMIRLVGSAYIQMQFSEWLSFKSNFGINHSGSKGLFTIHRDHPTQAALKGTMTQSTSDRDSYTWTNTLNFMKTFNNRHDISGVAGYEIYDNKSYSFSQTAYDIDPDMMDTPAGIGDKTGASDNRPNIDGSKTRQRLMSMFTQWNYGYDNRYIASASLRYDESSKFQGKNKGAAFYSVGMAWNIHNEAFMKSFKKLDQLKLRASFGTTGNQDGIGNFVTYAGYDKASYAGTSGYVVGTIGNPDLRWEKSAQFSIGVDMAMYNGRLKAIVDYYRKDTRDLIMSKSISRTSGFRSITTNAGSVRNSGIEVTIEGSPIQTKNFSWTIGGNFTYNKNQMTDLGTWANEEGEYRSGSTMYALGEPLGTWARREWGGIDPQTGNVLFVAADGSLTPYSADAPYATKWSTYNPPYFGGWYTNIRYKGFAINAQFNFALGNYIMDGNKNYIDNHNFNGNKPKYLLTMWQEPGDITTIARFNPSIGTPSPGTNFQLSKGDYMRLKLLKISYTLSKKNLDKIKLFKALDFFVQGENLWTITNYSGQDPEVNGSTDNMAYPKPLTLTGGVNIRF